MCPDIGMSNSNGILGGIMNISLLTAGYGLELQLM